jgi:hypothetical protein
LVIFKQQEHALPVRCAEKQLYVPYTPPEIKFYSMYFSVSKIRHRDKKLGMLQKKMFLLDCQPQKFLYFEKKHRDVQNIQWHVVEKTAN